MFKTFLKPKWVLLAIFVVTFSYFAFTLLAPWQLGKDHRIVERNQAIEAAYKADPVPLRKAVDKSGAISGKEWVRVALNGHYLPEDEVLLRLRPVTSGPAYQSLIPFADDSGLTMLVNRGWAPAGEANAVPALDPVPTGEVTVEAMVRVHEAPHPNSKPIKQEGYNQVYSINPAQVGEVTGTNLGVDYLQISDEGEPGALLPIPVPQLDRGSHLSYGFQWIAFGIMAPLGLAYFAWAEIRERRRFREEEELMALAAATGSSAPSPTSPQQSADAATTSNASAAVNSEETNVSNLADAGTASHDGKEFTATNAGGTGDAGKDSNSTASGTVRRRHARYGDAKPDFYAKLNKRRNERF